MIIKGKKYEVECEVDGEKTTQTRRAVYMLLGEATPEQKRCIERLEKGFHGDWNNRDPYNEMRNAGYMSIELGEERLNEKGQWVSMDDPDVPITNMTAGAL